MLPLQEVDYDLIDPVDPKGSMEFLEKGERNISTWSRWHTNINVETEKSLFASNRFITLHSYFRNEDLAADGDSVDYGSII